MKKRTLIFCGLMIAGMASAQQQGIINNADSPHVKLKSVNIGDCQWTDGFWADKFKLCEEVMVPHMGEILTGDIGFALDNFKIAAGLKEGKHQGTNWHDGDFYKWIEATMYVYAINNDPNLLKAADEYIAIISQAQCEDGYLSTQTQIPDVKRGKQERWSNRQLHEMYNSGHLLTSACIHHRITGQDNFLNIAIKHADFLCKTFMPCPDNLKRFGFNQTQIMGLAEMYRETGNKKYLQLAEEFINRRGESAAAPAPYANYKHIGDMVQERTPLRKAKEAAGHAVLALYYYAGAADVYAETGEKALIDALDRMWDSVVNHKMYITGACGQLHHGVSPKGDMVHEAFVEDYMMPNAHAYNETCANICNGMFSYRLLGIHGESKYADIVELVLYNSLSGISQDGTHYFYTNPLRRTLDKKMDTTDYAERVPYIPCFCCPPNLVRTVAKANNWAYSLADNGLAVNLYGGNKLATKMLDGSNIKLTQETDYPWDGAVKITVDSCKTAPFDMMLRIPAWAEGATVKVNGKDAGLNVKAGSFAVVNRAWKAGDVVELDIPMEAKLMVGNPKIEETRNQAAVKRGPIVYCMETPDLPEGTSILDIYLPSDIKLKPSKDPAFTDGLTTLTGKVLVYDDQENQMYRSLERKPSMKKLQTQFVPYYAWSNRGKAEMSVWLPLVWK
ncbi:glycoside hydrolase family 127 protein [Pontiella sulfatireligans]|uniref:Non-reducing end beta-L-arabinofuranosidase n=1 Tax=Pontiella sulfatireligans TaxID=2750658 RepID=A0A6C2UH46_9BACT|nr:beta-L-arabinofuranosidase domain-containing protein [Pontiella sulfatireligans]VGO18526.1 Non-reducing end beta-L-arabinofuranosidase [Pontiella sulfatireligans]